MINFKGTLSILAIFSMTYECSEDISVVQPDDFTSEWQLSAEGSSMPPVVSKSENHLKYVTFRPDKIRLESSKIDAEPCDMNDIMFANRSHPTIYANDAITLGNGKVVILILESTRPKMKLKGLIDVWLYKVNPADCSYHIESFIMEAPIDPAHTIIKLVPYQDSFDVFLKSLKQCNSMDILCNLRYNDNMQLDNSTQLSLSSELDVWDIISRKEFDLTSGYLYTLSNKGQIFLKYLDAKLHTLKSTSMRSNMVLWKGNDKKIGFCDDKSKHMFKCIILDSNLRIEDVLTISHDTHIQKYAMLILDNNDAVVFTVVSSREEGSNPSTYLQLIPTYDPMPDPILFHRSVCTNVNDLKIFKLSQREYCVVVICMDSVTTKCIRPFNRFKF